MAFKGIIRVSFQQRVVSQIERVDDGVHQVIVCSLVARQLRFRKLRVFENGCFLVLEGEKLHLCPQQRDFAFCARYACSSLADAFSESAHSEGGCHVTLILKVHHLIVDHIIVALIDAPAVRSLLQRFGQPLYIRRVADDCVGPPLSSVFKTVQIYFFGRIGAVCLHVALKAAGSRTGGLILLLEMVQAAKRAQRETLSPRPPVDQVQVVARFGHQAEGGLVLSPPVSAHIAVRKMPEADRLVVLDVDQFPDLLALDQLLDLVIPGRVPENVANAQHDSVFLTGLSDFDTLLPIYGHGLFENDVIFGVGASDGALMVILVLESNQCAVSNFLIMFLEDIPPVVENLVVG